MDELMKKHETQVNEVGRCLLSCNNFVEAMTDEDCMCITFSVSRTELSIVRPASLVIERIYPSIISAKNFLFALKHSLKIDPERSGNFDKTEGNVIKGQGN